MRTVLYIVFGAIAGLLLGILGPIGSFYLLYGLDPKGMQQGGGTPFAIMMIITIPAGAAAGAFYGYRRAHPAGELTAKGPRYLWAQFEQEYFGQPPEVQAAELTRHLQSWITDYRTLLYYRLAIAAVTLYAVRGPLGFMIAAAVLRRVVTVNLELRSVLAEVQTNWGHAALAPISPLPITLRPMPQRAPQDPQT